MFNTGQVFLPCIPFSALPCHGKSTPQTAFCLCRVVCTHTHREKNAPLLCIYTPNKVLPGVGLSAVAWEREQASDMHSSNPWVYCCYCCCSDFPSSPSVFSVITPAPLLSPVPRPLRRDVSEWKSGAQERLSERECGRGCLLPSF